MKRYNTQLNEKERDIETEKQIKRYSIKNREAVWAIWVKEYKMNNFNNHHELQFYKTKLNNFSYHFHVC